MKVLVTGASGFVGRQIVAELLANGHFVRALARAKPGQPASSPNLEFFEGDVTNAASLHGSMVGIDAVIHLVGIISEVKEATFDKVHQQGTENVVNAAKSAGVRRFVHMSALGTRPQAASRYHQSKWAAEEAVRQSGLRFTIFRPSIIYGTGDQFTNLFARISRISPVVPVVGTGTGTMQPIPVESVAKFFVAALSEPRAVGQTYDLGGPDLLTFNEVLDAILFATGHRRLKLHLPLPIACPLARMLELVFPRWLNRPPPLNRDQIIMLEEKTVGNTDPASELFRIRLPRFKEGLEYLKRR